MDQHRFDADPDPNFHVDADPKWHPNSADSHVDPTQGVVHMLEKLDFFEFKSQHCHFTMFIFLNSVKCVMFSVFWDSK